jgi:signal transduction histidine kinase
MRRAWVWVQLLSGWLPVWALYTTLIGVMHGVGVVSAGLVALRAVVAAALLGYAVHRLTERVPWPHPFRMSFVALHVVGAPLFAGAWVLLTSLFEIPFRGRFVILAPAGIVPFLILGVWLYVMVAGVGYAARATERAARAEAAAARAQLAALRGQLNPHFLFNALHTVVHLIPREPARAGQAAEQIAGLLRTTIEEDRDLVPLGEELAFVERYLELERLRFGERLRVRVDVPDPVRDVPVPAWSLQTLVENAVRHGAGPRVEPTDIVITARRAGATLEVSVRDNGAGDRGATGETGTGLARLRERLAALYDGRARLHAESPAAGGFTASLTLPTEPDA